MTSPSKAFNRYLMAEQTDEWMTGNWNKIKLFWKNTVWNLKDVISVSLKFCIVFFTKQELCGLLINNSLLNPKGLWHSNLFSREECSRAGVPKPRVGPRPVRNRATQQEVRGGASERSFIYRSPSLALLPEPSPPSPHGKISSTKPVPGAKKGWGPLL